jgi:transposase
MGDITLSKSDQRRADVLVRLAAGKITSEEAAMLLSCTPRHVRRLLARYQTQGLSALPHGNRGRAPTNQTPEPVRQRVGELAGPEGPYHDLNTCHLRSLLRREEQIAIGRSTLDRLLKEAGVRRPSRNARRRVYRRRERSSQEGFMLLIDGSLHDWLDGRGARMCLIGAIDDATGKVIHLRFWPTECLAGYLFMLEGLAFEHGLPALFYHDKHTILRSPKPPTLEDELAGREPRSQFEEVLALLGIEGVSAHSPQAKGRIERLWKTLQDRLVKELRLAHANDLGQANTFLPAFLGFYNDEFALKPCDPEPAWVTIDKKLDAAYYFARREQRQVKTDHTLSWLGQTLQICRTAKQASLAGKKVAVHIDARGELFVYHGKTRLEYRVLPASTADTAPPQTAAAATEQAAAATEQAAAPPRARPKTAGEARRRAWLFGPP